MIFTYKMLAVMTALSFILVITTVSAQTYDPASEIELTKIEYSWRTGHRSQHEKTYQVRKNVIRFTEHISVFGGEETFTSFCAKLTQEEALSLDTFARQIIRERWRNTKQVDQLFGAQNSRYGPIEEINIEYFWDGEKDSLTVWFSTAQGPEGTKVFTHPEVLLIQKLFTDLKPLRYKKLRERPQCLAPRETKAARNCEKLLVQSCTAEGQ